MKKTLCACMAAVLALASLPVLGVSAEETTYALGDVDMDGVVTGHDTAMVSRYVLDDTYTLTEEQLKLADVNEDGVVDQADADKINIEDHINTELYKEALDECVTEYHDEDPDFYDGRVKFFEENDQ